ncbi:hypothetical protein N8Z17_01565 [Flavobacteriaceae bacterium]|nr:hypothetical protein [Flavobacteriaceae bacterium]
MFDSDVFEVSKRDFRYIALLAYVNANRTKAFLELVAEDNKYLPLLSKKTFPKPYPGFQDDLEYHLHSILVSHKKENKLITTRINNFGQRKTGWLTYSPIKVRMNSIGKLEYINEINQFNKTQKTYL